MRRNKTYPDVCQCNVVNRVDVNSCKSNDAILPHCNRANQSKMPFDDFPKEKIHKGKTCKGHK